MEYLSCQLLIEISFQISYIDLAENYLKWIPNNTHTYHKFIKPEELDYILTRNNFTNINFKGLTYQPLKNKWQLSQNTSVNYFCNCKLA